MLRYLELRRLHFKNMRRIEDLEDQVEELQSQIIELEEYVNDQLEEVIKWQKQH